MYKKKIYGTEKDSKSEISNFEIYKTNVGKIKKKVKLH